MKEIGIMEVGGFKVGHAQNQEARNRPDGDPP